MSKKLIGAGLLVLVVASLAVIGGIFAQERIHSKEDPTTIQLGVMTEKQKEHSKLYKRYSTGRRLDVPPVQQGGEENQNSEVHVEPPIQVVSETPYSRSFDDFLREQTCEADAVVLVKVADKSSQLTEDRNFIFTDYTVTVEDVLKDNPKDRLELKSGRVITSPGGAVRINGRVARATDASFQWLEIGREYFLFLKYVPSTGAYQPLRMGSFLKADEQLVKLTEEALPGGDTSKSFSEVRGVVQSGCGR